MMHRNWKYGLWLLLWIMLMAPLIQQLSGLYPERSLSGDFILSEKPEITWSTWESGSFQDACIPYIDENMGFHNTLIRLNNQLNYSLFGISKAEGVVKGKNHNMFEYDYIRAYLGLDYLGEQFIDEKMRRVRFLQEYLLKEKNIHLCLIFEPTKVRFMPDQLPGRYTKQEYRPTNLDLYLSKADKLGINHINLIDYYNSIRLQAQYPLYPPYGIHWSLYGMSMCADTIVQYIDHHYPGDLPQYKVTYFESAKPLRTDNDIEKAMNLTFPLRGPVFGYPEYEFDSTFSGPKPNVLTVGDSYYFNIFNSGIPEYLFNNQAFWYFNSRVYPDFYTKPTHVKDLDIKQEVEKQDFIFLMITERFMHRFDWKFFDMVYRIYTPECFEWSEYNHLNDILNNDAHFKNLVEESSLEDKNLEQILWSHADFLALTHDENEYMVRKCMKRQMEIIRNDSDWYREILRKAAENKIDPEEMLELDAAYMLRQDKPEIFGLYSILEELIIRADTNPAVKSVTDSLKQVYFLSDIRAREVAAKHIFMENEIQAIEETIKDDPEWIAHIKEKALMNNLPLDSMIRMDAEYVFHQNFDSLILLSGK